ncbi:unnamed protein product [Prunus armeniaca]|uniref:Uncharacterized protein n=1 Tax=Prunus armeniaca TaxID=36596 RepID=A0A6J5UMJ6_PRUAR|nr:unnamed protein product [Prunus armeniaca]
MEISVSSMVVAILCVGLITLGWKVVNWVWLKPKKLERYLRQQGLSGNSYRLLTGDLTDNSKMTKEALSKPMEFSHDIVPCAPFTPRNLQQIWKGDLNSWGAHPL